MIAIKINTEDFEAFFHDANESRVYGLAVPASRPSLSPLRSSYQLAHTVFPIERHTPPAQTRPSKCKTQLGHSANKRSIAAVVILVSEREREVRKTV